MIKIILMINNMQLEIKNHHCKYILIYIYNEIAFVDVK